MMVDASRMLVLCYLLFLQLTLKDSGRVSSYSLKEATDETKLRHATKKSLILNRSGKYTTRELIHKFPTDDHPCKPTRTSVKITFPDMRSEILVNFLGYKEPNLIHLDRCKGTCGLSVDQISCIPTKVRQKKVKMTVKTQLIGRDPRERSKEILLEEHVECACQCKHISPLTCMGLFNNRTCECECDESEYQHNKESCEAMRDAYWDTMTCQCKSKSVSTRGVQMYQSDCPQQAIEHIKETSMTEVVSLVLLGCCFTASIFLAASTFFYHRKVRNLQKPNVSSQNHGCRENVFQNFGDPDSSEQPELEKEHLRSSMKKRDEGGREPMNNVTYSLEPEEGSSNTWNMEPVGGNSKTWNIEPGGVNNRTIKEIIMLENIGGGELYHEQYNEHGVMIEKNLSDHDLIQKYLG